MKRTRIRLIALNLVLLLMLSLCSVSVQAADGVYQIHVNGINFMSDSNVSGDNWNYESSTNTLYLYGYSGGEIRANGDLTVNCISPGGTTSITGNSGGNVGGNGITVAGTLQLYFYGTVTVTAGSGTDSGGNAITADTILLRSHGADSYLDAIGGTGVVNGAALKCDSYCNIGAVFAMFRGGGENGRAFMGDGSFNLNEHANITTGDTGHTYSVSPKQYRVLLTNGGMGSHIVGSTATYTDLLDYYPAGYFLADYRYQATSDKMQVAWQDSTGELYRIDSYLSPKGNMHLTACWESVYPGDILLCANWEKRFNDNSLWKKHSGSVQLPGDEECFNGGFHKLLCWLTDIAPTVDDHHVISAQCYDVGSTITGGQSPIQLFTLDDCSGAYVVYDPTLGSVKDGGNIIVQGFLNTSDTNLTVYAPDDSYLNTPSGKTLAGWSTSQNGEIVYEPGQAITISYAHNLWQDQRLYAIWNSGVSYTVTYDANGGTGTPSPQTKEENVALTLSSLKPTKSYVIQYNANGGSVTPASKNVSCTFKNWNTSKNGSGTSYASGASYTANVDVTLYAQWTNPKAGDLAVPTRSGYAFAGWFTSATGGTQVNASSTISGNTTLYAHWTDPYNMGDETYSFENYVDYDSFGHCFGMSITSAGYHNGLLDIGRIGGNANTPLYSFSQTSIVTQPICHYQGVQGNISARSIVAGGSTYLTGLSDISADWASVVAFVRDHSYDDTGLLQIGFRKNTQGGHAINFLRYENVNGQDRIYAYDNNFPDQETYFYQDSSGRVWQTPQQTFSGSIDCIALRDCRIYFSLAGDFDATHVLYMPEAAAMVVGYTYSYMEGDISGEPYVMYEIPSNQNSVIIVPLRDNADFVYMDTEYSFGSDTAGKGGELVFASMNEGAVTTEANFRVFTVQELEILQQPKNYNGPVGSTATISVSVQGDGLSYQWYFANPGATGFTKSGNKTATYTSTLTETNSGRRVYCVVKDQYGNSVTTNTVTMAAGTPVSITTQPQNYVGAVGSTATATVVATGEGLSYQWYFANPGATNFTKSGSKTATYSATLTAANSGRRLYCVIKDAYGNSVTTNTVTMSVAANPVSITTQPKNYVGAVGSTATATVTATGEGLTYQWYFANPGATSFTKSGSKTATYSATLTEANSGRRMYCVITDAYGNTAKTNTVTMSVAANPVSITTQPKNYVGAIGSTATATVKATGEGLTYQWYFANPGVTSFTKSGSKTATYSATLTAANSGRRLYCVIKDAYGNSVTTNTVTMTVAANPVSITTQPKNYVGAIGSTATATVKATGEGLTYQWYFANPGATGFTKSGSKTATYSATLTAANSGRRLYCVIKDAYGNSVTTNTVTMTASLSITTQPKHYVGAVGSTATATVTAVGEGLSYQWYFANPGATSFTKSGSKTATYSATLTATNSGRRIYCVITDASGNTVTTNTVTMSVG